MIEIFLYFITSFFLSYFIIVIQSLFSFYLFPLLIVIVKEKQNIFRYGLILVLIISIVLDIMYLNRVGTHGILLLFTYFLISLINFFALLSNPIMKLISIFILYVSYSLFYSLVMNSFNFNILNLNLISDIGLNAVIFTAIYYVISYFMDSNNKNDERIKVK